MWACWRFLRIGRPVFCPNSFWCYMPWCSVCVCVGGGIGQGNPTSTLGQCKLLVSDQHCCEHVVKHIRTSTTGTGLMQAAVLALLLKTGAMHQQGTRPPRRSKSIKVLLTFQHCLGSLGTTQIYASSFAVVDQFHPTSSPEHRLP